MDESTRQRELLTERVNVSITERDQDVLKLVIADAAIDGVNLSIGDVFRDAFREKYPEKEWLEHAKLIQKMRKSSKAKP